MDESPVEVETLKSAYLSMHDVRAAVDELTAVDHVRLAAIDARLRGGTGLGKRELVQEAVCRALEGRRQCRSDLPFLQFLAGIMHSVASHERERACRILPAGDAADLARLGTSAIDEGPEEILLQKEAAQTVDAIRDALDGDDQAQLVLMGWSDDLRGAALREATGLTQGELDYAIRRIRMKARNLYPDRQRP